MDFSLNAEQQLLKDSIDKYMAERYDADQRRQYLAEETSQPPARTECNLHPGPGGHALVTATPQGD